MNSVHIFGQANAKSFKSDEVSLSLRPTVMQTLVALWATLNITFRARGALRRQEKVPHKTWLPTEADNGSRCFPDGIMHLFDYWNDEMETILTFVTGLKMFDCALLMPLSTSDKVGNLGASDILLILSGTLKILKKKLNHNGTTENKQISFHWDEKWYIRLQILRFSSRITSEKTVKHIFIRRQCYSGWSCSSIDLWMINFNFIGYYITDLIKDGTFPNTFMIFGGLVWVLSSYVMSKITCLDARVITEGTSKRFLPSVPHEVPFQWLPTRSSKVTFITF